MVEPPPRFYQAIVESSTDAWGLVDADLVIRYASPSIEQLLGHTPADLIGRSALDLTDPDQRELAAAALAELTAQPDAGVPLVFALRHRDGSIVHVEVGAEVELTDPDVGGIILRLRRHDDQRLLERYLETLATSVPVEQTLQPLVEAIRVQHLGSQVALLHDWDGERFTASVDTGLPHLLKGLDDPVGGREPPWVEAIRTGRRVGVGRLEELHPSLAAAAADAGLAACWAYPVPVPPDRARLACLVVWRRQPGLPTLGHDQALQHAVWLAALGFHRRHNEDLLLHAALHDTLTGIPNRSSFFQALDRAIAGSSTGRIAVLFADLDGFKEVNDTYGHGVGDDVLAVVARRLQSNVRPDDVVARVGGDEFAVLCTDVGTDADAITVAQRLIEVVGRPVRVGDVSAQVGLSIGVAFHEPGGEVGERVVDAADHALYEAKQSGKNRWIVARVA